VIFYHTRNLNYLTVDDIPRVSRVEQSAAEFKRFRERPGGERVLVASDLPN